MFKVESKKAAVDFIRKHDAHDQWRTGGGAKLKGRSSPPLNLEQTTMCNVCVLRFMVLTLEGCWFYPMFSPPPPAPPPEKILDSHLDPQIQDVHQTASQMYGYFTTVGLIELQPCVIHGLCMHAYIHIHACMHAYIYYVIHTHSVIHRPTRTLLC